MLADSLFARIQLDVQRLRVIKKDFIFKECRGCPKNGGSKFLCLDGCFTSARYKAKGADQSQRYENHYIADASHNEITKIYPLQDEFLCNTQFEATSGKAKGNKLDETGHFGLACARHEVLLKIVDMHTGERFIYPDLLLKEYFKESSGTPDSLSLYYDVMCRYWNTNIFLSLLVGINHISYQTRLFHL